MATNIAPMATPLDPELMTDEPAIEIEISIEDEDGVEIEGDEDEGDEEPDFDENLAEILDESKLQSIASELVALIDSDITSRKDWTDMYVKGLEVLGMKYEERTEPWSGACGVFSPLLTEAGVRFQSEMITETFPAQGPVKTQIIGEITREKEDAAARVRDDMNYRLTEEMIDYRPEHERMLFSLGLAGAAFKKVYQDPNTERAAAPYIPAEDLIIPYGAANVYVAERVTHIMRKTKNEVKKLQVSGFYRNVDLGEPVQFLSDVEKKKAEEQGYSITDDERHQLYEVHVDWDLEEDENGLALPYVITIDRGTNEVLAIRRNWEEDDEKRQKRQHFVQYTYVPGFGAYGLGFIHIIGGFARAGTTLIRQLVDSGTLANLPGGLKARGLRIKGDDTPIAPGEFRDVDVPSGAVRDNIMPLPYKEPSQVLYMLLERITEEGRRLAAIGDLKIADMSAQAPVGTTLAILERTLKIMSAVQARVHASLRMEFKLLKAIIRDHAPDEYSYVPMGGNPRAKKADYDIVEVIPVSDPNAATMAQRIMQYQAALQLANGAPHIYNLPYLHRQMLEVLGIKNADKLVSVPEDQKPRDPISENMGALKGIPMKAFIYQDHDAHIAVHQSMMQDPAIMAIIGQSPAAQQVIGALQAHIADHLGFQYRKQIEERLGAPMPVPDAELPPEIEVQLSRLVAQAAVQLTQMNQQKAAQQQAMQQAQDPLIQMQQKELELKAAELERKRQEDAMDFQIEQERLKIEREKLIRDNPQAKIAMAQQDMQIKAQKARQEMQVRAARAQQDSALRMQRAQQKAQARPQPQQMPLPGIPE